MPKREKIQKSKTKKAKLIHKYYERTGFYSFVGKNLKSAILPIIAVILVIFLFNKYVYNIWNETDDLIVQTRIFRK